MKQRNYIMYIEDIQNSIERIFEYTHRLSYEDFESNFMVSDATIRNFEIIGEASNKIPDEIKLVYSEIPWEEMYHLRNKISHEYFGVDLAILWDIIINYLPENYSQIKNLLLELKSK